jgi:hypothetical protein
MGRINDIAVRGTGALKALEIGGGRNDFGRVPQQGRREPTGPAKALIRAITNDPKHVLKALEVGATMRKTG